MLEEFQFVETIIMSVITGREYEYFVWPLKVRFQSCCTLQYVQSQNIKYLMCIVI